MPLLYSNEAIHRYTAQHFGLVAYARATNEPNFAAMPSISAFKCATLVPLEFARQNR